MTSATCPSCAAGVAHVCFVLRATETAPPPCSHVATNVGPAAAPVARCLGCGAEWPGKLGSEVAPDADAEAADLPPVIALRVVPREPDPFVPRLLELLRAQGEPSEAEVERVARYLFAARIVDAPGVWAGQPWEDAHENVRASAINVARAAMAIGADPARLR